MVTSVGTTAPETCASIRCRINSFAETEFADRGLEWIMGARALLELEAGVDRLGQLAATAIRECLRTVKDSSLAAIPLLLCTPEPPLRPVVSEKELLALVAQSLSCRFHEKSTVIARGQAGIVSAIGLAARLIEAGECRRCIIAGADSLLLAPLLATYERSSRLLTSENSNGFIPGEAGAAILIGIDDSASGMFCLGIGSSVEASTIESDQPLRADGLAMAIKAAVADARVTFDQIDYRVCDANGEQYRFREAALAMSRTLRTRKQKFEIWHPADCVGEVGAAIGPLTLGLALTAAEKKYAPGPGVLCHFSSDGGDRGAVVLRYEQSEAN